MSSALRRSQSGLLLALAALEASRRRDRFNASRSIQYA